MGIDCKGAQGNFGSGGSVLKPDCGGSCIAIHFLKFTHS